MNPAAAGGGTRRLAVRVLLLAVLSALCGRAHSSACLELQVQASWNTRYFLATENPKVLWTAAHPTTVEVWARMTDAPTASPYGDRYIFLVTDSNTGRNIYSIQVASVAAPATDELRFRVTYDGVTTGTPTTALLLPALPGAFPARSVRSWQHYAFTFQTTYNATGYPFGLVRAYVNGTLHSETAVPGPPAPHTIMANQAHLRLQYDPLALAGVVSGMREFRVWGYARTAMEILADVYSMYRAAYRPYSAFPLLGFNIPFDLGPANATVSTGAIVNEISGLGFQDEYGGSPAGTFAPASDAAAVGRRPHRPLGRRLHRPRRLRPLRRLLAPPPYT